MRGRPSKSEIRQNITDMLFYMGKAYGYELYKKYLMIFPKCTREVIYYHLKKGVVLGEFAVAEVRQEKGDFSWGGVAEKTYYELGPNAQPRQSKRLEKALK